MNKKFLFGLLASVAMVGCSDNNGLDDKENGLDGQKGTDTYLTVNIMDASSLTRATGGDPDSVMINGTHDEHEVASADFYFYDKNGIYVSKANVWRDGEEKDDHGDLNKNVEYLGESVVVLKGMKDKTFPNYMVTVLNAPEGFTPGATLDEMQTVLTYASLAEGASCYKNGEEYFIMSTTSYKHPEGENLPYYFVTELKDTYFNEEPIMDLNNVVEVFVERLAAKVVLKVDNTKLTSVEDKGNVYEIEWTIAGENNKDESSASGDNVENPDEEGTGDAGTTGSSDPGVGAEKLRVHFLGWGLNATMKNSYMMKNIDESWTITSLGFAWNSTDFKRSYWGKSYNYGKSDDEYLNYISYNDLKTPIYNGDNEGFEYCAENTNTADVLRQEGVFASRVTSILLKAMITDSENNPLDLVSYRGMLYEKTSYLNYVLSQIKRESGLNAYWMVDENKYTQIDAAYVTLVSKGSGRVKVQLKEDVTLYYYDETKEETNKFVPMNVDQLAALNTILANFNDSSIDGVARFEATAYTGGMMYYNIPIEHLNDDNDYRKSRNTDDLKEANYGIVRNHLYEVTINSLKNPGYGVFDPTEVIIPKDEKEDPLYYVGATINILPWKIVKQNVDL